MISTRLSVIAALACLSAAPAFAQGTISSGTTFLQFVGTPFSGTTGNANLLFGSTSAFGTDELFQYAWAYNQGVATSNRPFSSADTPVQSYAGNTATFTWTNAGAGTTGFARWNAVLTISLTEVAAAPSSSQPGAAIVNSSLSFTANGANSAAIAFSVFNALDLDLIGTGGNPLNDTYSVLDASAATGIVTRATDSGSSNYALMAGYGASRYEFNTGSALRTKLGFVSAGTGSGNLSTAAGTSASDWSSTDGAVAFQWTRTLAPGESFQLQSSFSINTPLVAVPEPASWALLAGGGALLLGLRRRRRD
jgi:hypothetical protein